MNNGALTGLTADIHKRDSAARDLNTLNSLLMLKKQKEQEEQQAQIAYQEIVGKVQEQTNMLLENDRYAINQKALKLQSDLKEKIKALGGSKRAFMQNGGMNDILQYKNDILNSEEFSRFKNNRINLERLLMVKERGMGHLINIKDEQSLQNYYANNGGEITYTGILNEIDVDENAYAFGHDITPEEVLAVESNRMKIISNFESDTGEKYIPRYKDEALKDYIKFKGYGGRGKNVQIYNALKEKQEKESEKSQSINTTTILKSAIETGAVGYNDISYEKTDPNKYATNRLKMRPASNVISKTRGFLDFSYSRYRPKGALAFGDNVSPEIFEKFTGLKSNDNGKFSVNALDLENIYRPSGEKLKSDFWGVYKGDYKPKEMMIVYKGKDRNGDNMIISEAVDSKGNIDQTANSKLYGENSENFDTEKTLVVRMEQDHAIGDFYYEIPLNGDLDYKKLQESLGVYEDISGMSKEDQALNLKLRQNDESSKNILLERNKKIRELNSKIKNDALSIDQKTNTAPVFSTPFFNYYSNQYKIGNSNRSLLLKSFYQALGQGNNDVTEDAVYNKRFDDYIKDYGLETVILDNSIDDLKFIDLFYKEDSKRDNDGDTYYFKTLWKTIFDQNLNK